jgi:hypothetical protein
MARLLLDGAQEHLPAQDNRIPGHWKTVSKSCLSHRPCDVTPFVGPSQMRVGGCGHAAAPC